jgi:CreA protein
MPAGAATLTLFHKRLAISSLAVLLLAVLGGCGNSDQKVDDFANDWTGNEFEIKAVRDPKVPQVLCHFGSFNRSFIDRVGNGNWFENPSNTSVDCNSTGPIDPAILAQLPKNAEVFSKGSSLFFKSVALRRIVDLQNNSLVYVSYSRELTKASAKLDMSAVFVGTPPAAPVAPAAPAAAVAPAQ